MDEQIQAKTIINKRGVNQKCAKMSAQPDARV